MRIDAVRYEGGELILTTGSPDARKLAYKFKAGEYELKPAKRGRSLDANAFAWALIHEVSAIVKQPPADIYREAIRGIGGVSEIVCVKAGAAEKFKKLFISGHIGSQVTEQPSKLPGCVTLICTYGSSDYDTRQMSRLIENLLQDAHALGIKTPEDERIEQMLEEWDK